MIGEIKAPEGYFERAPPVTSSNLVEIPLQVRPSILQPSGTQFSEENRNLEPCSDRRLVFLPVKVSSPTQQGLQASKTVAITCVKLCSTARGGLEEACTILVGILAVATIFEKALVENRARAEEGNEDKDDDDTDRTIRQ